MVLRNEVQLEMPTLKVAADFSPFPGGRYRKYGPYSGEEFREAHLLPTLDRAGEGEVVVVDLADVFTFPPSFLDEAFAALVRKKILTREEFDKRISFRSDDANRPYIDLVKKYLDEAAGAPKAAAS